MSSANQQNQQTHEDVDLPPDDDRREALARIGRLAAYTAPVMMTLLGASKARAGLQGSQIKHK